MNVAEVSLHIPTKQDCFYKQVVPEQDIEHINDNIPKIAVIQPQKTHRVLPAVVNVPTKGATVVKATVEDIIKQSYNVNAEYTLTIYLFVDDDENPPII
jgi:hypothetical protein